MVTTLSHFDMIISCLYFVRVKKKRRDKHPPFPIVVD